MLTRGYDFVGNVVGQRESHRVSASRTDVLEVENSYDDRGRLLSSTTRLNGGNPATVEYTYDAVGRLVGKTRGNGDGNAGLQREGVVDE